MVALLSNTRIRLRMMPSLLPQEVELRNTGTVIQWRYVGQTEAQWVDLLSLDDVGATVEIGEVSTLDEGAPASVENAGTSQHAVLNIGIPRGFAGAAATIAIGAVTTVEPDDPATVVNVGTEGEAVFDFEIPQGLPGASGEPLVANIMSGDGIAEGSYLLAAWMHAAATLTRLKAEVQVGTGTAQIAILVSGSPKLGPYVVDAGTVLSEEISLVLAQDDRVEVAVLTVSGDVKWLMVQMDAGS